MNQTKNEKYILLLVSLACVGVVLESYLLGWEFWVPPLILVGGLTLWAMQLLDRPNYALRKYFFMLFAVLTVFFHGVHGTSFFDVSIVSILAMVAFSMLGQAGMIHLFYAEFYIVLAIQFVLAFKEKSVVFDSLNTSRIILHIVIETLIYFTCLRIIANRRELSDAVEENDEKLEAVDADMEDFLSNISHELRTPVNVVNGMSSLLIKRSVGYEAEAIKNAGIRLAYQIEDIQDYTECKRQKIMLEEEEYISTSLINDVVTCFRLIDNNKSLELVVDLDPHVPLMMKGDIKKMHKIFRHLLENAEKFTKHGGIFVRMFSEPTDYGVNLCIEMTDTGIGMDLRAIHSISEGMYQADKKRNRNSGGIGLGLFIVYGFVHRMGGFVKIESEKKSGTTVRVTIPQKVTDPKPCLSLSGSFEGDILFHVRPDKYKVPRVRDFYRVMASNLASGIRVPLYPAESVKAIERLQDKLDVTYIFMGQEEYEENSEYFDELSKGDIVVAVSAAADFSPNPGSKVLVMPKPLYAYPVIKILNEGRNAGCVESYNNGERPVFPGVKALIVDDEPMNLVVASGLFKDYQMEIDTADSGRDAIIKYRAGDYDVVFMDHMMPEMDGVEAMKEIRKAARETGRDIIVIVLTANVVSGAREMFMREGFDGFVAKPIHRGDFERVMLKLLPDSQKGGEQA
ncbi:MAG: response regulator [Lachnospiraceae bacterium]|nr:response regulator [Lachnospiraceae bacterium]